MTISRYPLWIFLVVAVLIAIASFAIGQVYPGLGAAFAGGASTLWAAFNANRARKVTNNG